MPLKIAASMKSGSYISTWELKKQSQIGVGGCSCSFGKHLTVITRMMQSKITQLRKSSSTIPACFSIALAFRHTPRKLPF